MRDSNMRAMRNVDGIMPDSPECSPSRTMSIDSVTLTIPRSEVVSHIRS